MSPTERPRSILVPVLDGDITESAFAYARTLLASRDARLVILCVARADAAGGCDGHAGVLRDEVATPRWRQLAAVVRPDRVFVDAVIGDAATVIRAQADRFGSDVVILGEPQGSRAGTAWIRDAIAQLRRDEPGRVRVIGQRRRARALPAWATRFPTTGTLQEATS